MTRRRDGGAWRTVYRIAHSRLCHAVRGICSGKHSAPRRAASIVHPSSPRLAHKRLSFCCSCRALASRFAKRRKILLGSRRRVAVRLAWRGITAGCASRYASYAATMAMARWQHKACAGACRHRGRRISRRAKARISFLGGAVWKSACRSGQSRALRVYRVAPWYISWDAAYHRRRGRWRKRQRKHSRCDPSWNENIFTSFAR